MKKENNKKKNPQLMDDLIKIPQNLLHPIGDFLSAQLSRLEHRVKETEKDDPFKDTRRLLENASPDSDAAEQFGHARVSAIKEELEKKIDQTKRALSRLKFGKYGICENCGEMIDTDRLSIYPEATLCISCEKRREK